MLKRDVLNAVTHIVVIQNAVKNRNPPLIPPLKKEGDGFLSLFFKERSPKGERFYKLDAEMNSA